MGSDELCAVTQAPVSWAGCSRPALGSVFEPHGNTNLCNLITTLAQPVKDGILSLSGLAEAK